MKDELFRTKRSFALYCRIVHGITDRTMMAQWFEMLQSKYDTTIDLHVAIIMAYWWDLENKQK